MNSANLMTNAQSQFAYGTHSEWAFKKKGQFKRFINKRKLQQQIKGQLIRPFF